MKKIFKTKWLLSFCAIGILVSCTKDFEAVNTNPNAATTAPATNILASGLVSVTNLLFGTYFDIYYAGSYASMTASYSQGDYEYRADNATWNGLYSAMSVFVNAMNTAEAGGNTNLEAAALTMKAFTGQKTTDIYGDVPYSEAFQAATGVIYPVYDKQSAVYSQLFAELKKAADMFKSGTGSLGAGDLLFHGDILKWQKFCNSMRLRLAIRVSNVDPVTAKSVISEILGNPNDYPVMTMNDENAYFVFPGTSPDQELWYKDPGVGNHALGFYRMGYVLINALAANNDPRLPVYALPNRWGKYNGYRFYAGQLGDTLNNGNNVCQIGDRFANNPKGFSPYMNCAEVYFIMAEAYERGLVAGDAQAAYNMGITKSMEENGIGSSDITTFLSQPEVNWNTGTSTHLQKIGTQKYISLFKNSVEAWSEERRTDIPLMTGVSAIYAANHNRPPFRESYLAQEQTLNGTNYPTYVKIVDIFWGDQMWWDTRTGVH